MKSVRHCGITALLVASISLAGCAETIFNHKPGNTFGEIYVGSPKISTRERLINDRLEQDAWLKRQLAESDDKEFGVQGRSDIRSFAGTVFRAGVQADASVVRVYRAQQDNALQQAKRQREVDDLDTQIVLARKRKLLEKIEKGEDPAGASDKEDTSGGGNSTKQGAGNTNTQRPSLGIPKASSDQPINTAEVKKPFAELVPSPFEGAGRLQASPIDEFRDRLALRQEIRDEIVPNLLDERHDLRGHTLYRLGFDTTILPGDDTSAWAVVEVCVTHPTTGGCGLSAASVQAENDMFHGDWARAMKHYLNRRVFERADQLRYEDCASDEQILTKLNGRTGSAEINDVATGILACSLEAIPEGEKELLRVTGLKELDLREKDLRAPTSPQPQTEGLKCDDPKPTNSSIPSGTPTQLNNTPAVVSKYTPLASKILSSIYRFRPELPSRSLAGAAELAVIVNQLSNCEARSQNSEKSALAEVGKQYECLRNETVKLFIETTISHANESLLPERFAIASSSNRLVEFKECKEKTNAFMEKLGRSVRVSAYASTPKEMVQRINELASRRTASEFTLAVGLMQGTVASDTFLQHVRVNEGFFEAMQRQPLVVGFSESNGQSKDSTKEFSNFGWILGPRFTVRDDGKGAHFRHSPTQNSLSALISIPAWWDKALVTVTRKWVTEKGNIQSGKSTTYEIQLPVDLLAATEALAQSHASFREPSPDLVPRMRVDVGKPASFEIRGRNLWRNTTVLLGSQVADYIVVLPSMEGILARFDRVSEPTTVKTTKSRDVDLVVWTSEGRARAGRVEIASASKQDAQPLTARPERNRVVVDETTDISLSAPLNGFHSVEARLRSLALSVPPTPLGVQISRDFKTVVVLLPDSNKPANIKNGEEVGLELAVKKGANEDPVPIPLVGKVVYFDAPASAQVTVNQIKPSAEVLPARLEIKLPLRVAQAFKGFDPLRMRLTAKAKNLANTTLPVSIRANACMSDQKKACEYQIGKPGDKDTADKIKNMSSIAVELELDTQDVGPTLRTKELTLIKAN